MIIDKTRASSFSKARAYQVVFQDLTQIDLFKGIYDAKNGSEVFMDGIWTVMEYIAQGISDEWHDRFDKEFIRNMVKSEEETK